MASGHDHDNVRWNFEKGGTGFCDERACRHNREQCCMNYHHLPVSVVMSEVPDLNRGMKRGVLAA